ncbi:MAG: VWA domain-containing protein [Verrucomicrobiaceae bacterium]|nr:MAG: VWA domain-containing protein [Verrucomicrobiaceae bacterium]
MIEFLVDETGSMSSYIGGTISGFNTFLDEQKTVPGEARFTLTKFSTYNVVTPYQDLELSMVQPLSAQTFVPSGGTNLYDTMGARIEAIRQRIQDWTVQPRVLFVVLTDGEDNSNHVHRPEVLRTMITGMSAEGWTFVYLGAHGRALQVAHNLGFHTANVKQFDGRAMHQTMTDLSASTKAYRAGAAQAAQPGFFS